MVTLRWWHFLIGGGVLAVLMLVVCGGVGYLLFARGGGRNDITAGVKSGGGGAGDALVTPSTPIAPIDTGSATVIPTVSNDAASNLPRGVRPLKIAPVSVVGPVSTNAAEAPPAPPAVRTISWYAKVDPPASVTTPTVVENFDLPEGGQIVQGNWPWPHLVIKTRVSVNGRSATAHQVWDLSTGKGIASFPIEQFNGRDGSLIAVSPDGAKIAVQAQAAGDRFITVASLQTGVVEKTLELSIAHSKSLRFIDANRLLIGGSPSGAGANTVQIYDIAAGKAETLRGDQAQSTVEAAISPGGKHVALRSAKNQNLMVFQTDTGGFVGEIDIKFSTPYGDLRGIAFSPDGRQLGFVFDGRGPLCYVAAVDVAYGTSAFGHVVPLDDDHASIPRRDTIPGLQWLPDGRTCLILGRELIDCQTGVNVGKPTAGRLEMTTSYRFDGTTRTEFEVPVLNAAWLYGDRLLFQSSSPKLFSVDVAAKGLAAGAASDAGDLPLTEIDVAGVQDVVAGAVPWSVPFGTPALLKSPVTMSLPSADAAALFGGSGAPAEAGSFNSLCFGKAPVTKVLLTKYVPDYHAGSRSVHPYDLSTGVPFSPFRLPRACDLVGLHTDADQVLTINRDNELRVDLWSAVDGHHVRGWQPYEGSIGEGRNVAWADFAADGKVLTLSQEGNLICWAADAPRAVYRRRLAGGGGLLRMSSNKTWLVGYDGQVLHAIDANTGHNLGAIPLPGRRMSAAALRGDDRMLAALIELHDGSEQLCVFDLSAGSILSRFAPSTKVEQPAWIGDSHLLCNRGAVIDLNVGLHVWSYPLAAAAQLGECGGCVWLLDKERITACKLADLPSGRGLIGAFAAGATPLFAPNDDVAFSGGGDFAKSAEDCITDAGFRFRSSARRKLRVTVRSESTGEQYVYGTGLMAGFRSPRPGDVVMNEVKLKALVELLDESGGVAWSTEYTTSMPGFISGRSADTDIQSAVHERQQRDCASQLARVTLPQHVVSVDGKPVALPGRSFIAEELYGPPAE
jgi:hypothetical protein